MSPSAFNSLIIAVSGSHKGYTQAKLERMIVANGGAFSKVIDDQVTHLVTTQVDYEKPSVKVKLAQDIDGLEIVSLEWLLESIEKKKRCPEANFLVSVVTSAAAPAPQAAPQVAPAPQTASKSDTEELPKKRKARSATVAADEDKAKGDVQKPPAKKAKSDAKGKGKAKKEPEEDDTKDDEEEEDIKKKEEPKMKTIVKKGKAPVDEFCPIARTAHVYVDPSGCVYDATLNQANIGNNNNKFYYCQLLESDSGKSYSVFAHWGRVGDRGQTKMYLQNSSLSQAISQFEKLFKGKTGVHWDNREAAKGGSGKYTYLERNYEEDEEDEEMPNAPPIKKAQSKLNQALQSLISLIFDTNIMQQSMKSMSYDSRRLPLGKLSKKTILEGYQVLKSLGQVIEGDGDYLSDFRHLGSNKSSILTELSNQYYSIIPHVFPGRDRPIVIDDDARLKVEIDLVENLTDMVITTKILNETKSAEDDIHPLDKQFESLGLNEAEPLDPSSTEYKNLEAYLLKSRGHTHYTKLAVQDIFRIRRSVEEERWQRDGWDKIPNSSRRLLWHGSRSTNFAGILSQGLRIAPPEAPVNGYMFDKGIYLADIVTKSANYCCAHNSGGTGLLLLCEAQLGDPMYECRGPDYHAATKCKKGGHLATMGLGRTAPLKWEDASVVSKELKGIQMPKVSGSESNITGNAKTSGQLALEYNEYIVYNVSQVKIRYLFKCSFT